MKWQKKHADQIQSITNKANDDRIATLQKLIEDNERSREKQMQELKAESEKRLQEVKDSYERQRNSPDMRTVILDGHPQNGPIPALISGVTGLVRNIFPAGNCSIM